MNSPILETATFGAGCFWGAEEVFRRVKGVKETAVGYMGGIMNNPNYKDVCTGKTGHAEVVQIKFDPGEISYEELLKIFWENHDPTTLNRQGPDIGTQYRSVIFFHSPGQKAAAQKSIDDLERSRKYKSVIVTQVVPAQTFSRAEEYHQRYLEKRGMKSCAVQH